MILKETVEDNEYVLDTAKLKNIEFPFYTAYHRSAYYVPADKNVYLPLRYRFDKGTKDCEAVYAKMTLPDGGSIQAHVNVPFKDLLNAMVNAAEKNTSLFEQSVLAKKMEILAKSVYSAAQSQDDDIVMEEREHELPSFIYQDGELIAIASTTVWNVEDDTLYITFKNARGTFLRAFKSDEDREVSFVIINEDGTLKLASLGEVHGIHGNEIKIMKEKNTFPSKETISSCEEIYEKYKDNLMKYFFDKEDEERGDDFGFSEIFKED